MELTLWLYFYDNRWFFSLKLPLLIYRLLWVIPFISHILIMLICLYYSLFNSATQCDKPIKLMLFSKAIFSLLLAISMVLFYIKIKNICEKESRKEDIIKKHYPTLKNTNNHSISNYYLTRKCLLNTNGIVLFLFSIVSLYWSYLGTRFYRSQNENNFQNCDRGLEILINRHSSFILYGNSPIIVIFVLSLLTKLFSIVSTFFYPSLIINIVKNRGDLKVKKII